MDDNTKIVHKNGGVFKQGGQTQPQASVQPVKTPISNGVSSPVGSPNKETGPVSTPISELASEKEPQISQELKDMGVEEKNDRPDLTDKHKGLVHHAGPHVAVPTNSSGKVILPMSEEEITSQLKSGQDDDSKKGLAKLLDKVRKALGL